MNRSDLLKATPGNFMLFMNDNDKVEMLSEMFSGTTSSRPQRKMSHYERTRAQVYATGNKWAIENFEATHN